MTRSTGDVPKLSKKELEEFKQQLLAQKEDTIDRLIKANARFGYLLKRYVTDQGADPLDRPQTPSTEGKIEKGLIRKLENTDNALMRINNGTFGICERCGNMIEKRRLKAVLTTRICMGLDCE